jgi:hypothetical protein
MGQLPEGAEASQSDATGAGGRSKSYSGDRRIPSMAGEAQGVSTKEDAGASGEDIYACADHEESVKKNRLFTFGFGKSEDASSTTAGLGDGLSFDVNNDARAFTILKKIFVEADDKEGVVMHGFMFKKSEFYANIGSSDSVIWKKRWFMLGETGVFRYCRNPMSQHVDVTNISLTGATVTTKGLHELEFELRTGRFNLTSFIFRALQRDLKEAWIQALQKQIANTSRFPSAKVKPAPPTLPPKRTMSCHVITAAVCR